MYKINNRETLKTLYILAFMFLALVSIILLAADFSLLWKIPIEIVLLLIVCILHFRSYGIQGKTQTQKAKDRVSTAVIGLLHSTNGISSLQAYNSLIRDNLDDKEKALEILDHESVIIDEYADKVKSIVSDLSESFRTEREKIDISQLTRRSAEFVRLKRIRDRKIPLNLSIPDQPVYASVYPSLLKTAVENILENSYNALLEADVPDSHISIAVENKAEEVSIIIKDNGNGFSGFDGVIPPEFIKPGRSLRKDGNGLGLYVAVQSVKECGGSLEIISKNDGLTSVITLPGTE